MKIINGKVAILIPPHFTQDEIRAMGAAVDCILKHDTATGMPSLVPRNECVRPAEDMRPKVVSIARFQPKQSPETFAAKWNRWTNPDGPSAA